MFSQRVLWSNIQGVKRRMVLFDIFFEFLKLLFFAMFCGGYGLSMLTAYSIRTYFLKYE